MSALMIIYKNVSDPDAFQHYSDTVIPFILARGGTILSTDEPESLEGDLPWQGAVVFRWPSKAVGIEVWRSPEYAEIKKLRKGVAEFQCVIVNESAGASAK